MTSKDIYYKSLNYCSLFYECIECVYKGDMLFGKIHFHLVRILTNQHFTFETHSRIKRNK